MKTLSLSNTPEAVKQFSAFGIASVRAFHETNGAATGPRPPDWDPVPDRRVGTSSNRVDSPPLTACPRRLARSRAPASAQDRKVERLDMRQAWPVSSLGRSAGTNYALWEMSSFSVRGCLPLWASDHAVWPVAELPRSVTPRKI